MMRTPDCNAPKMTTFLNLTLNEISTTFNFCTVVTDKIVNQERGKKEHLIQ